MNPIISSELTLFAKELQRFLSAIVLQETAKQVGFVQRSSKYQANGLIALCVWLSQEVGSTSLTQLCSRLEASTGVLISPEGLNQRFNPACHISSRSLYFSSHTKTLFKSIAFCTHDLYFQSYPYFRCDSFSTA